MKTIIKTILLIISFILLLTILNSMPSDLEVMKQSAIDNDNIRIELAKQYQLEQIKK